MVEREGGRGERERERWGETGIETERREREIGKEERKGGRKHRVNLLCIVPAIRWYIQCIYCNVTAIRMYIYVNSERCVQTLQELSL